MAHYGTLRDYHFSEDIDDIRGANVYGVEHEKLGEVADAVLDHDTGEVGYLVVDTGQGRKHMLPADRVYRSVADENDFDVNLRRSELESLPAFDHKSMGSQEEWRDYEKRYHESYRKWEQEQQRRYEEGHWHEAPVQHRQGSTHNITPEPEAMPASTAVPRAPAERVISGRDLTPERLADKFDEPTSGGASNITAEIAGTPARADDTAHSKDPLSPRFQRFRESIRRDLENIRRSCLQCSSRKVA